MQFILTIPRLSAGKLLYSNKPPELYEMIPINPLIYAVMMLNSEAPYVRS